MGLGSIALDAATLGSASLAVGSAKAVAKLTAKAIAKAEVREMAFVAAKEAAETSAKFTKSSLQLGQKMHKAYKTADVVQGVAMKEYSRIPGIRPDFVNLSTRTIYELKPNNPRAIKQGLKQLEKYKKAFEQQLGGTWETVLDTY